MLKRKAFILLELIFALSILGIILGISFNTFGYRYLLKKRSDIIINYLDYGASYLFTNALNLNTFKLCSAYNLTNPCLIEKLGVKSTYKLPLVNCVYNENIYSIICQIALNDTLDLEALINAMREFPFNTQIKNNKYFYFRLRF